MTKSEINSGLHRRGWLVVLGACLLAGLPGCFTPELLSQKEYEDGLLGSPEGVYVSDSGTVTVLVPLRDTKREQTVGMHMDAMMVGRAVSSFEKASDLSYARIKLAGGSKASTTGTVVYFPDQAGDVLTRADIAQWHGPGEWVVFAYEPPEGLVVEKRDRHAANCGIVLWTIAEIDGQRIPLRIQLEPGGFPHPTVLGVTRKVVLLPVALVGDVVLVTGLAVLLPVTVLLGKGP